MGIWKLLSLAQWHQVEKKSMRKIPDPKKITIFGSFLDKDSLEIAYKLVNSNTFSSNSLSPVIDLVFFPITRFQDYYYPLFEKLEVFLLNHQIIDIYPTIFEIITQANWIQKRAKQILNLQYNIDEKCDIFQFKSQNLIENNFFAHNKEQYGLLAALYLKSIKQFPTIFIAGRIYNGIPLNFSLDQFLNSIIYDEISIICKNTASIT